MEKIRTFIAIELSQEIRAGLAEIQERLKAQAPPEAVRWVQPESIHLTLKFLGEVPAVKMESIRQALERAVGSVAPFSLSCGGLGCFPNPKRPRVIWVGVEEKTGRLSWMQQAVEAALSPLGYRPEARPFHPHLTLGRVQSRVGAADLRRMSELMASVKVGHIGEMEARYISLMRSDLHPEGAIYTQLAQVNLAKENRL
ncbi:MAG: RNA 2',3'-cyclic phosphodiesterase [Anaerolineae bacterium]